MKEIKIHQCICGHYPEVGSLLGQNRWFFIACPHCKQKTETYYKLKSAAKAWNKWMEQLFKIDFYTTGKE